MCFLRIRCVMWTVKNKMEGEHVMAKVKLILNAEKVIRGKKFVAGSVLEIGETSKGIECSDLDKAIKLGEISCVAEGVEKDKSSKE